MPLYSTSDGYKNIKAHAQRYMHKQHIKLNGYTVYVGGIAHLIAPDIMGVHCINYSRHT